MLSSFRKICEFFNAKTPKNAQFENYNLSVFSGLRRKFSTLETFIFIQILVCPLTHATNFGVHGQTFLIEENDLIEEINAKDSVAKKPSTFVPTPLPLQRATEERVYSYDPSITANRDILSSKGEVIVARGTHYNPLDATNLAEELIFFDSRDPIQLQWAIKRNGVLILTGGNPFELMRDFEIPVYFDQSGMITKQLGISSVPAIVTSKEKTLHIREVLIEVLEEGL